MKLFHIIAFEIFILVAWYSLQTNNLISTYESGINFRDSIALKNKNIIQKQDSLIEFYKKYTEDLTKIIVGSQQKCIILKNKYNGKNKNINRNKRRRNNLPASQQGS